MQVYFLDVPLRCTRVLIFTVNVDCLLRVADSNRTAGGMMYESYAHGEGKHSQRLRWAL